MLVLVTVIYPSATGLAAVKLPAIETSVIVPNVIAVAGAEGVTQGVLATEAIFKLSILSFGLAPVVPPVSPL